MRSHGVKLIVMGRILEMLYKHANASPSKRTMTADAIFSKLKNETFSPRISSYLRGGITKRQVAWLLSLMSRRAHMPFGFIKTPLVTYKRGWPGEWGITNTAGYKTQRGGRRGD